MNAGGVLFTFECEHEWYWIEKANSEYCYKCKQFNPKIMTTDQKQEELIKRFGNKFYNELGLRVTSAQQLQGRSKYKMDSNSLVLAKQVVETLWKEWVEDCEHEGSENVST